MLEQLQSSFRARSQSEHVVRRRNGRVVDVGRESRALGTGVRQGQEALSSSIVDFIEICISMLVGCAVDQLLKLCGYVRLGSMNLLCTLSYLRHAMNLRPSECQYRNWKSKRACIACLSSQSSTVVVVVVSKEGSKLPN